MITPSTSPGRLRALRDRNTDDLLQALGAVSLAQRVPGLRRLFDGPSLVLARRLAAFDEALDRDRGARRADVCRSLLESLATDVRVGGASPVSQGPRLYVANHPGLGDVLAVLSTLGSSDVRIVARDRPFLRALPGLARSLFLVPESGASVLRRVRDHLAQGGAVLTFPAGRIEVDPAWRDPSGTWPQWSASTEAWYRTVPGLTVQPVLVAGVRARGFVDPWITHFRPVADRDWTAAVLQLIGQVLWKRPLSTTNVVWGEPLSRLPPADLRPALEASLLKLSLRVRR